MMLMMENDVYDFIYRHQKDTFIQLNDRFEIIFVNSDFCKTFNVDETLVVGKKIWEFLNEKLREQVEKEIKFLNKFKTYSKASYKIRLGNQKSIWQEWNFYAILDQNKKVSKYFIIAREVEEDKTVEALLAFQRDLLLALSKSTTLETALEVMIEKFSHIGVADSGILYIYNKTDDVFYLKHFINLDADFLTDKKVYNKVYEEYQDAINDRVKYSEQIDEFKKEGVKSLIKIPLNLDEETVGIFVLTSHKNSLIQTAVKLVIETLKMQISSLMLRLKIGEEYQEEHKKISTLMQVFPEMLYKFNITGKITRIDKNGDKTDIPLPDDILSMLKNGFKDFSYEKPQKYNYNINKNGNVYTYESRIIKSNENDLLISIKDVSHIKELNEELFYIKDKLDNVLHCGDIGYWELDKEKNHVFYNDIYLRLLGVSPDELKNTVNEWEEFIHIDDRKKVWHAIHNHIEKDTPSFETKIRIKSKPDNYKWELLRGKVVKKSSSGEALKIIGVNVDITNIRKVEEKVKEHYITDSLTHLYNKKYFLQELEKEFKLLEKRTEAFSLALISLDEFDQLCSLYGDDIGDFVLEKFAGFLKENIRNGDIIARYKREKFVLLLKKIKKQSSSEAIKRLQDKLINTKKLFGEVELELTFSTVICDLYDLGSNDTREELLEKMAIRLDENPEETKKMILI